MNSIEIFNALENIRTNIQQKKASAEQAKEPLVNLNSRLRSENPDISEVLINTALTAFQNVFIDNAPPNEDALKSELRQALPEVNIERCNLKVYQAILPYAKLMYECEKNGIAIEHAYKLSILFSDEKKALGYIKEFIKANPKNNQVMHDANLYALPSGEYDVSIWHGLCEKHMKESVFRSKILPRADVLETFIRSKEKKMPKKERLAATKALSDKAKEIDGLNSKYKKFKKADGSIRAAEKKQAEALARELSEKQKELTEIGIPFSKDLNLTALQAFLKITDLNASAVLQYFLDNGLTEKDFAKFVNLKRVDNPTQIPAITIDGAELGYPGIYLMKVDVLDEMQAARAACLGKLTNCCQSLSGEAGEPCAIHGLTSEYGGFYVVCKGDVKNPKIEDKLLGQCWAWQSQSGALVFDSIESSGSKKTEIVRDFYQSLGKKLVVEGHTHKVSCGAYSGISSSVGVNSVFDSVESFKDYYNYNDSRSQRVIYNKNRPYYVYGQHGGLNAETKAFIEQLFQDDAPLSQNQALMEMLNWAMLEKREYILQSTKELSGKDRQKELEVLLENMRQYINKSIEDKDVLSKIERNKLFVNIRDVSGNTPLLQAAQRGDSNVCLKLIEKGADVNLQSEDSYTALHVAVKNGHSDVCLTLIDEGADVNVKDRDGRTALHMAIANGRSDVCLALIEKMKRADVNLQDKYGRTAFYLAIKEGFYNVCLELIKKGGDVNVKDRDGRTALHMAIDDGRRDVCLALIEKMKRVDVNLQDKYGRTAFYLAIKRGFDDVCLALIDKGVDVNLQKSNYSGMTALHWAASNGKGDVCFALIKKGVDVNLQNWRGETALHLAAEMGLHDVCLELIKKGADVNLQNNDGNTALRLTIANGRSDVCLALIEKMKGADVNLQNNHGMTVLHLAAEMGLHDVCLELIKKGADVNVKDRDGRTALHMAIDDGRRDVCLALIEKMKGADVNLQNNHGMTVLHLAAINGRSDVCQALINKGADVNLKNKIGMTALQFAAGCGHSDVCLALIKRGAEIEKDVIKQLEEMNDPNINQFLSQKQKEQTEPSRKRILRFGVERPQEKEIDSDCSIKASKKPRIK